MEDSGMRVVEWPTSVLEGHQALLAVPRTGTR